MKKHIITILLTGSLLATLIPMNLQAAATTKETVETEARDEKVELPVLVESESVYAASSSLRRTAPATQEDWEIYRSDYCYDLLSDTQKQFYDGMDQICLYYAAGVNDAEYKSEVRTYCLPGVSYTGLSDTEVMQTLYAFLFQNPQYYFLDKGWVANNSQNQALALTVYQDFASGTSRSTATANVFATADAMIEQVNVSGNAVKKEQIAHDLITSKVIYASDTYDQSAYSVFTGTKTVCAGYAQAFALVMNACGVETLCTTSVEHEWNKILLYGNWYNIDLTWDDTDGTPAAIYLYFNRSDEAIKGISAVSKQHHTEEKYWDQLMPAATTDSGATEESIGRVVAQNITAENVTKTAGSSFTIGAASDDDTAELSYQSSNPEIAAVDEQTGEVTTYQPGVTQIQILASETEDSMEVTKTITLTVNPKKVGIRSVTSTSTGSVTLNWTKQEGITGYYINISKSETFSTYRSIYINDTTKNSQKITNLVSGKKYYLRIRAVKATDSGSKLTGAWSKVVTTKAN